MSEIEKYYDNPETPEEVMVNILYDIALTLQNIESELSYIRCK